MLSFLHLVTVGTSTVRNASSNDKVEEDVRKELASWTRAGPGSDMDLEAGKKAVPGSKEFDAVLGFVASSPRRASAELNAFIGYLEYLYRRGVRGIRHHIILLGSDTGVGWFSTRILEEYLKDMVGQDLYNVWGIEGHVIEEVTARRIEKLGVDFSEGILNLIAGIKNTVLKSANRYDRILANLTGGFKPESAAVLVAAGLIGIDAVYYIHEVMRDIVELPVIPLNVDDDARKLLLNALNDNIGLAEKRLLDKLGLPVMNGKISPWAKRLLELLLS